jgi:hypothetical protein
MRARRNPARARESRVFNMHHFAWTDNPTVVQINLEGPFDIFYVNPADDRQKRQTTRR